MAFHEHPPVPEHMDKALASADGEGFASAYLQDPVNSPGIVGFVRDLIDAHRYVQNRRSATN